MIQPITLFLFLLSNSPKIIHTRREKLKNNEEEET